MLDEITHKLSGASIFSILDAKYCFWVVQIVMESSFLTSDITDSYIFHLD